MTRRRRATSNFEISARHQRDQRAAPLASDPGYLGWLAAADPADLAISALTFGELKRGVMSLPPGRRRLCRARSPTFAIGGARRERARGVLALAAHGTDPRRAIRVAATHVLGFRATLERVTLQVAGETPGPALGPAPDVTALVVRAAPHPDAHLAKYTLACLDAADHDREARDLYLAAAAHLGAWLDAHPGAGFDG